MPLTPTPHISLTTSAQLALDGAARYAAGAGSTAVEPEHLLLALLDAPGSMATNTIQRLNANVQRIRAALGGTLGKVATPLELSEASRQAQLAAFREAQHLGHYQVDAVHLLMGLLYDGQGRAAQTLAGEGITLFELRQQLLAGPRRWSTYGWRSHLQQLREIVQVSKVFWTILALWVASGVGLWLDITPQYIRPFTMLFVICGWIVSLCLHEFGHALAAYYGGDKSTLAAGYLSLNPLRYANPIFSVVIPVIFLMMGGLGLPGGAVYVNTAALRGERWQRIVSAAGPIGTLIFGLFVVAPFWFLGFETLLSSPLWPALALLGFTQVSALLFNLLPIPPLDGFGIVAPSLPSGLRHQLRMFSMYSMLILYTILWNDNPISSAFWETIFTFADTVGIPVWLLFEGLQQFLIS